MGLAYRATPAVTTSGTTTETSWAVTKQAGTAAGDWIFIYVFGGTTSMACTGFTAKPDSNGFGGLLYRQADGTEGSSFTITGLAGHSVTTLIATISGGAAALDPATVGTPTSGGAGTSIAVASVTLADAGDWCLWFAANQNGFSGNGQTITAPAGFSSQATNGAQTGSATLMLADNESIGTGATGTKTGTFGGSTYYSGVMAGITPGGTTHSGTATLTGSGTLQATGAFAGAATLAGTGTLSWSGSRVYKATVLSGTGTLTGTVIGTISETVTLTGTGTLTGAGAAVLLSSATLAGTGTLTVPGVRLGFQAALSGTGTLSIIGTGGTVQAAAGASVPQAYPGASQISVAPPGTGSWCYLGQLGTVTALTYSFACPGGADQLTATIMIPAAYRTQLLNPGWQVRVTRGGHIVWSGKLDEPVPTAAGWQLSAVGDGNRGTDFLAVYSGTWPAGIPDDPVNEAITRGLPWANAGIGSPAGIWTGQAIDSGAQTITDLLTLLCTRGALTWYVDSQPDGAPADLAVFPLPTAVNRLLVVTDPVARTLGGDINTLYLRYEIADGVAAGTAATYGTTSVQNTQSVTAHGVMEAYLDLSSAGVMTAAAARAVGNNVLAIYQRASFAGPFTASYGQLLSAGGVPVDPGTDQAGTVVRLILTDYAYGGEVTPAPITFIVGAYLWDDFSQQAQLTPYQALDMSLSGLLSMESTVLTPITVVS